MKKRFLFLLLLVVLFMVGCNQEEASVESKTLLKGEMKDSNEVPEEKRDRKIEKEVIVNGEVIPSSPISSNHVKMELVEGIKHIQSSETKLSIESSDPNDNTHFFHGLTLEITSDKLEGDLDQYIQSTLNTYGHAKEGDGQVILYDSPSQIEELNDFLYYFVYQTEKGMGYEIIFDYENSVLKKAHFEIPNGSNEDGLGIILGMMNTVGFK